MADQDGDKKKFKEDWNAKALAKRNEAIQRLFV